MEDNYSKTTYFMPNEAGVPASDLVITIFDGTGASREIDLASFGKAVITFGRDPSCDIVINSPLVSRHHGVFKLFAGNICIIEDSGSTNGLIFNGEAIKSRKLQDGDSVRIDDGVETTAVGVLMYVSDGGKKVQWRTFPLAGHSKITIGRNTDCDICLNHVSVSKLHARITIESDGAYITDTNSTNGVTVNGKRISGRVKLHEKDLIIITNSQLVYTSTAITYCCFKSGISVNACNVVKKVGKKKLTICDDVSLSINPCELVAIIGGSGAGKSTIMNCISGYSIPTYGRVYVNDTDLYENYDALKSIIGYVP